MSDDSSANSVILQFTQLLFGNIRNRDIIQIGTQPKYTQSLQTPMFPHISQTFGYQHDQRLLVTVYWT